MIRNEPLSSPDSRSDRRPRLSMVHLGEHPEPRTIVIRQASGWQSLAVLFLCLLLIAVVLLGHQTLGELDLRNQQGAAAMARVERKLQQLEAGTGFDSRRRQLLLGMRDHILRANPRVSLGDAYRYAELALEASEKYPAVDPLLLLAIGSVESGYNPQARSHADARGLYQIWPSTGRLLARSLGWDYDDQTLYDPEKNTQAAALYLDVLFAAYNDPQMVLAEYNGGPVNAGYFRADVRALAAETRNYVPRVLELYERLTEQFEKGVAIEPDLMYRDGQRQGKRLGGGVAVGAAAAGPVRERAGAGPAVRPAR